MCCTDLKVSVFIENYGARHDGVLAGVTQGPMRFR